MSGLLEAKVKSVLSGDTIVLHHVNNPRQERTLSLAYVSAPRLRREGDEPFAFESRDYLRRLLVGRVVRFQVSYTIPTGVKRDYGIVQVAAQGGARLPDAAVSEGWVKLRDDAGRKEDNPESTALVEQLQVYQAHARADSKGVWAESGGRIESLYELPDARAFVEQVKGKPVDSIIEKVLSGDRLIARLLVSPTKHVQTMLLIAGLRAPATKRTNPSDGKEQPAEPFGEDAQLYVESRLLQRNVNIDILGVNPQGQLIGNVKHPTHGAIAPYLLKAGLARCTDHHTTLLGSEMQSLRQAEKYAKDNKIGLFKGHVATRAGGEAEAVVSKVQTADTLYIRTKAGAERRVNLSSVRQPKPSDPKQAPFGADAKEFLRKKLIAKHVKVTTDGKRPASDGYDAREMVTVTQNNKNIALLLVESGYASVIRHRSEDTDRSPIYDDLLLAEQQAQSEQKGMWSPKPPAVRNYVDYSQSLDQAKRQLTLLSRQRRVPSVVDFVKGGSRFTVLIPRENAKITLVLSGIRAPRSARTPQDTGEPFGQEAHDFANRRCLQRDAEIDVEDCDKVGGFIGALYINRENFAKLLLEEGLASVHAYSAEKSGNANELFAAEQKAKDARKGMWHNWDPSQDAEGDDTVPLESATANGSNGDAIPDKPDYRDVVVTHVDNSGKLKVQQVGGGTAALTELMNKFRTFHLNHSNASPLPGPPKAGDIVAAKFTEDGEWYRARVRRNDRDAKKAEVVYIDYGNSETLPWTQLRPLTQQEFSLTRLKAQAQDATLTFLQFPVTSPEYMEDAIGFLSEITAGRQLVASVDATTADGMSISLFDPKEQGSSDVGNSINAECVSAGVAMVARKLKPFERNRIDVLKGLQEKEKEAKDERRGMWEYGDLTADD